VAGPSGYWSVPANGCIFPWDLEVRAEYPGHYNKEILIISLKSDPAVSLTLVPGKRGKYATVSQKMGVSAHCEVTAPWKGDKDHSGRWSSKRSLNCVFLPGSKSHGAEQWA